MDSIVHGVAESDVTECLSLYLILMKDAQVNQHGRTQSLPESRQRRRGDISTKRESFLKMPGKSSSWKVM